MEIFYLIVVICSMIWIPIIIQFFRLWRKAAQCDGCLESFPLRYQFHLTDDGVALCDECWIEVVFSPMRLSLQKLLRRRAEKCKENCR